MTDYSQKNILKKMIQYMHIMNELYPGKYKEKDIKSLKKQLESGHCY